MKETYISDFHVIYEDNAESGIQYLREDLDYDERKVFFNEARRMKQAKFEDHSDRQFTLFYDENSNIYELRRRE